MNYTQSDSSIKNDLFVNWKKTKNDWTIVDVNFFLEWWIKGMIENVKTEDGYYTTAVPKVEEWQREES